MQIDLFMKQKQMHTYEKQNYCYHWEVVCVRAQSCLNLCTMDCSQPGSSIHGIFQARILEWIVVSFSNTTGDYQASSPTPPNILKIYPFSLLSFSEIDIQLIYNIVLLSCLQQNYLVIHICVCGFPGGLEVKASACNVGDPGLIPGWGKSPGEGNGNPLQYSCLENPMERGTWQDTYICMCTSILSFLNSFLLQFIISY